MSDAAAYSPRPAPIQAPRGAWAQVEAARDARLDVDFVGRRGALFWLALKTGLFTILTLGFYRFWMKTRLRRWYWSAIRPGGHPMEYVGDPFEKLLGFFIAVVILTFYIGVLNLLLMFVSFSIFNSSAVGYVASFAGVIPLWFYARYRARRYVLARTRWRGVRFGLEPGAWGYAWRALVHWAVTILTLGLLWPRMTFALEKYRTDRTFFGSTRLVQDGRWTMLYRAAVPFGLAVLASLGLVAWLVWLAPLLPLGGSAISWHRFLGPGGFVPPRDALVDSWRVGLIPVCLAALVYGAIHYRWVSKRILANHKRARGLRLSSALRPVRVSMIYVFGTFLSYLALLVGLGAVIFIGAGIWGIDFLLFAGGDRTSEWLPRWLGFVLFGVAYFGAFLLWNVLHHTFVTFPLLRHMAITTALPATGGLAEVSQRKRDAFAEAEGFAEALDLGAAI